MREREPQRLRNRELDRELDRELRRWLAAEGADPRRAGLPEAPGGSEEVADAALTRVLGMLPPPAPAPGFAAAVMQRFARRRAAARRRRSRWLRAAALAALPAAALVLALVPALLAMAVTGVTVGEISHALSAMLAFAAASLVDALDLWRRLQGLAETLLTTPSTALAATVSVAVAGLALALLSEIIARERSSRHATAIS